MKTLFLPLLVSSACFAGESIEMAVTIDDLPASAGEHAGITRTQIAEDFIKVLKKHKVPGVYGFVNGILAKNMAERQNILKLWKEAGYKLSNHTYAHKDLSQVTADEFIQDIENNETTLLDYASDIQEIKYLRFPYLQEGESKEKRYAIRSYLAKRKYKVAPVTIDFEDWAFGPAYIRCSTTKNSDKLKELSELYLDKAVQRFKFYVEVAKRIYGQGRKIKHILLLHMTSVTANRLDQLLGLYEKEGVKFISFESAANDSLFQEDTSFWNPIGKSFLIQAQETRNLKWRDLKSPEIPRDDIENFCK